MMGPRMSISRAFDLGAEHSRVLLGAVTNVIAADGVAGEAGRRLLEMAGRELEQPVPRSERPATDTNALTSWRSPSGRRWLVDAAVVAACIDGEVTRTKQAEVERLASVLAVASPWVRWLDAVRRRRIGAVRRALYLRSPDARRVLARTWAEEGLLGIWRALRFVLGLHRDPTLAARFRALGELAPGSVGRSLFDDFSARGLSFPGERGGLPERMFHHDLMHVVNGYGTDPSGECELAGFYAGFVSSFGGGDGFTFIATALATFHLGLPVSPAIVHPATGAFDPARVMAAFDRGRCLQVDIMGAWDYWPLMPLTVEQARARLGIADAP
jgi:hypothetical protein